ncbi:MAG: Uncharacterized protein G01um101431_1136 [Parcubacteria group bacterium Gr01-1014_31]|nr:MAG: Uncharacterized protein G01um101431_1136 [Parcubacteria group bacterium Gr01-1014_31]
MPEQNILLRVKLQSSVLVAASLMVTVSALAMSFAMGMMAVAAGYQAFGGRVRISAVGFDPCAGRTDCALSIATSQQFDQLVADFDREDRRGAYVSVVVPRHPEIDIFCAGHERCLSTPLFYNRRDFVAADFIQQNYPDAFAGLNSTQIRELFFDRWDGTRTAVYDFIDLHRILQDPTRYGTAFAVMFDPSTPSRIILPQQAQVTAVLASLQQGVGLGPVHYYPNGKYQELTGQARAWQAAGATFPIFYETLWTNEITSEDQFRTLLGCSESDPYCRLMVVVPRPSKIDAYCAPFRAAGKRCLDQVVFANATFATWHLDVLRLLAPDQVAGFEGFELPPELFGPDGVYRTGSLWRTWPDPTYRFSLFVNLGPGGFTPFVPTLPDVVEFYQSIRQGIAIPGAAFAYVILSDAEVAEATTWEPQEFAVILPKEGPPYEPYTLGTAYGRLRLVTPQTFQQLQQEGNISWQDILVFDEAPFDVETPVTAVITGTRQVTNASHLSLRMARRNRPNAYVDNAATVYAPYDGQLVKISVESTVVNVNPATAEEVVSWQEANRPRLKPPQPTNATYRGLDRVREMTEEPTSTFSRYGGKVNGLAKLYRILVPRYQLEAFGIPFSYFYDFLRGSRITSTSSFPAQCRWAVTYEEFYRRLLADTAILASPKQRDDCLNAFWDYGKDHGTIPNVTLPGSALPQNAAQVIADRISQLWNDANKDGRDDATNQLIRVRFRSSSNMEDGLEFNGAGLYESRTVCLSDQYDGDTVATCDSSEDHEQTVAHALRDVWMSAFLPRAFEERLYWQLPNEVAMAILVNTGTPDERDNGVAFTGNPAYPTAQDRYHKYQIFAQTGDISVVSPDPGVMPEVDYAQIDALRIVSFGDVIVYRARASTEVPAGQLVLTAEQVKEMGWFMYYVEQRFPLDRGPYAPERVLLDFEFKHLPSGQLIFKQVRPYLIGEAARFTDLPVLPQIPSGVTAETAPTQVTVRWSAGPADALAVVERSFTGAVWNALDTVKAAVGTVTDTTVRAGSSYQYRVRFVNLFGASDTSSPVVVTMPVLPQCSDTADNDGDGKTDSQDPGCQNAEDDDETDPPAPQFRRGDADASGAVNISDAIFTLKALFVDPNLKFLCDDAADANDDGLVNISDPMNTLNYLFTGTGGIPFPGPQIPGPDPTADPLGCVQYP